MPDFLSPESYFCYRLFCLSLSHISDHLWGERLFQLFVFFFPVRIGSTLLIYLRKCFLFFLLLFFPWWRSVHGLFLEMFAVGEQLLLFHYPSMFSWEEMCALGWVALCHWERVAGDRAKIKLQTAIIWITVSTGVFPALCKSLEL